MATKIQTLSTKINTLADLRNFEPFGPAVINIDGYSAIGDGGDGNFYWDSSSVETDNNGTIIQPSGVTTGRWKRQFSGPVNVRWFGAKGNGINDDSIAFRATQALLVSNGGGTAYVPAGTYLMSSVEGSGTDRRCITPSSNIHWTGDGYSSVIKLANSMGTVHIFGTPQVSYPTVNGAKWSNLKFDGNGLNNPNTSLARNSAIFVGAGSNCIVEECNFVNCNGTQIICLGDYFVNIVRMSHITVRNCLFHDVGIGSVLTDNSTIFCGANHVLITGNKFTVSASNTIAPGVATCIETYGSNHIITNNDGYGYARGYNYSTDALNVENLLFSNNTFINVFGGIALWAWKDAPLRNITIENNTIGITPNHYYATSGVTEFGIRTIQRYSALIPGAPEGIKNLSILNNKIYAIDDGYTWHFPRGIYYTVNTDGLTIRGNTIENFNQMGINFLPLTYDPANTPPNRLANIVIEQNTITNCGTDSQSGILFELQVGEVETIYFNLIVRNNTILDTQAVHTMANGIVLNSYADNVDFSDNFVDGYTAYTTAVGANISRYKNKHSYLTTAIAGTYTYPGLRNQEGEFFGQVVSIAGQSSIADGRGGLFVWTNDTVTADDNVDTFVVVGLPPTRTGCWKRLPLTKQERAATSFPFTILNSDWFIGSFWLSGVNPSLLLPVPTLRTELIIKDLRGNADGYPITITTTGGKHIDASSTSKIINVPYGFVQLLFLPDTDDWWTLSTGYYQLVIDGSMERSDTIAWTAGNSAILSKDVTSYITGTQSLKITYGGSSTFYAYQSWLTIGKTYRMHAWMQGDGAGTIPEIFDGGGEIWLGSDSSLWQEINITWKQRGSSNIVFIGKDGTGYVRLDALEIVELS